MDPDLSSLIRLKSDAPHLFDESDVPPKYLRKCLLVTNAIDQIGFGKYQTGLFFVAGFGWFADNAWPLATSYILQRLNEVDGVHYPENKAPYLTLAQNLGLLAGALVWSLSSDVIGRQWAFNLTFIATGVFGVAAGASPNFVAIGVFCALWSFGVGGNLPVDSAIFLESLPRNKKWLLTVMSAWWSLGQVITALLSWALIPNFSCKEEAECLYQDNMGWRYFLYTLGGLTLVMFLSRFIFPMNESPTFYLARGNNLMVIKTLDRIASINNKFNPLTLEELEAVDAEYVSEEELLGTSALLKQRLKRYNFSHIRQCFASKRLTISCILVFSSWALVGLAFPLYNAFLPTYLASRVTGENSVYITYRNTLIVAVIGIPGAILAGILVELRIGRKGTLCGAMIMTGVVLFGSTTAKSSNAYLVYACFFNFFSNIMYGILYAYTPEVFPTRVRGTAVGLASSLNRVFGVFAPIIAIYADLSTSVPIYMSGVLFMFSGILVVFYPYEPRNVSSL